MENNESIKNPQTGGLKLMTVFIAVLALHVLVIGGITVYHLMSGPADPELADKAHKSVKATADAENTQPDASADKNTVTTGAPSESDAAAQPAPTPAPAPAPVVPAHTATTQTPSGPTQPDTVVTPPAEPPTMVSSGPVQMPVIPMTPQVTEPAPIGSTPYVVKPHDSLAKIAHQHHITVAKLKAANSLTSDLLHIGQKLTIPSKGVVAFTGPDTEAAPTVLDDSAPAPVTPKMAKAAKTPHITAEPMTVSATTGAPAGHKFYTVVKGDTLGKIAHKFKTTTSAIMAVNALGDAGKISIGQKIRIPSKEARSATNAAPAPATPETPAAATETDPTAKPTAKLANFTR